MALGLWFGVLGDNGKQNGNYYNILGLYRDNGKQSGINNVTVSGPLGDSLSGA